MDSFMIYTITPQHLLNSPSSWSACGSFSYLFSHLFSHLTLEAALIKSSSSHSQECSEHSLA
ncbi:hypothetical protein Bca4012_103060 [Brassica carinata]